MTNDGKFPLRLALQPSVDSTSMAHTVIESLSSKVSKEAVM